MRLKCYSSGVLLTFPVKLHISANQHVEMYNCLLFGIWKILVLWASRGAQPSAECRQVWCYWWVYACWSSYCDLIFWIVHMW